MRNNIGSVFLSKNKNYILNILQALKHLQIMNRKERFYV